VVRVDELFRIFQRALVGAPGLVFLELETANEPFDTVVCSRVKTGELIRTPMVDARFVYEAWFPDRPPWRYDVLEVGL
jgi:hypothetical protein